MSASEQPEWKSYEQATRAIFERVVNQDLVKTIEVKHDVEIVGRSTTHQIDVYWVFEVGGVRYQSVVQCKNWNKRIEQVHVFAFKGVLDDIPGRPRGFMVSKEGFQEGAIAAAKEYDISLYELRPPDNDNLAGRICTVVINGTIYSPRIDELRPVFDITWLRAEAARCGIAKGTSFPYSGTIFDNIVDGAGEAIGTFESLGRAHLMPRVLAVVPRSTVRYEFATEAYLPTPNGLLPRLRLQGIEGDVEQRAYQHQLTVSIDDFVALVLKPVESDDVVFFTKQGEVVIPGSGALAAGENDA